MEINKNFDTNKSFDRVKSPSKFLCPTLVGRPSRAANKGPPHLTKIRQLPGWILLRKHCKTIEKHWSNNVFEHAEKLFKIPYKTN